MHDCLRVFFPTLVLTPLLCFSHAAHGAKETPVPILEEKATESEFIEMDPVKRGAVDIAPAPAPKPGEGKPEFFYRYRSGLSPLLGIAYDTRANEEEPGTVSVMAIRYLFASESLTAFEAGAELLSNGSGAIEAQKRFHYSRTRFRPYTALGGGVRIVPKDEFATILKYEHFQGRASAGFEYFTNDPMSARVDTTAVLTLKSIQAQVSIGCTWAW